MHRFFIDPNEVDRETGLIRIVGEDVKHIGKVLRLKEGQEIELSNGLGLEYRATIQHIGKDEVNAQILNIYPAKGESELKITLYQGLPKSTKMDTIVQKCTELGIQSIIPINTDRTIVQLDTPKAQEKKIERWQRIAYEAAKQSKRGMIPQIGKVTNLTDIGPQLKKNALSIVAYENEKNRGIKELLKSRSEAKSIGIIIGPEGGFEEKEIKTLEEYGVFSVSLGPRILRTETAGFTILTILMYELGDMGGF